MFLNKFFFGKKIKMCHIIINYQKLCVKKTPTHNRSSTKYPMLYKYPIYVVTCEKLAIKRQFYVILCKNTITLL